MKKKLLVLSFGLASLAFSNSTFAQRQCAVVEYHEMLKAQDPAFEENQNRIEQFTQRFISEGGEATQRAVITIPVVVHVVYNTTAENISDAQVLSQIAILNADFRKLNSDASLIPSIFSGVAADSEIEFCLATVDPNGAATNGIVRRSSTVTSFSSNNAVKYTANGGSNAWPAGSYLNIWVCDLGSGLLGYAQFPGGAAATDGIVCDYAAFGNTGAAAAPFNKGRTATHEVGHWLNLRHIWGDATCGSDLVNDTPTHNTSNGGCPSYPHYSTCSGTPIEQTMNYMDYTDDACMYMFTTGQKARMTALFAAGGARASLLSSAGCGSVAPPVACAVPGGLVTSAITTSSASLSWSAVSGASSYDVQFRSVGGSWASGNVSSTSANLTGLSAGTDYEWSVRANCSSGTSAYSGNASFTSASAETCSNDSYESNETFATAKTLSANATYSSMKICSGDVDWFKFSSTSSKKKVRVRIYNLPADYDLELYSSNGTLLGSSANGGTTAEGIYYNANGTGTYYAKVFGYAGASSNTAYTIRCETQKNNYTSAGRMEGEDDERIMELNENLNLMAYPNPTNDMLNLTINGGEGEQIAVNIYDMNGRLVHNMSSVYGTDGLNLHVDMSQFKGGLYLIEVSNGDQRTTQRVLKN